MTDSIIENDPGWQSFAKAVRDLGRDWLSVATVEISPYQNVSVDELIQQYRRQKYILEVIGAPDPDPYGAYAAGFSSRFPTNGGVWVKPVTSAAGAGLLGSATLLF